MNAQAAVACVRERPEEAPAVLHNVVNVDDRWILEHDDLLHGCNGNSRVGG